MKPIFSIVTITYNRAHLIGDTIQSVLNQTYKNFEHIIIDDGSTDNTEQIITKFNDKRIKYFKYKKNGLLSFLRNEGVRKAQGEFVSILDSDDIWREDKLQIVKDIFKKYIDIKFIIHNVSFIKNNISQHIGYLNYKSDFNKIILKDLFSNTILAYPIYTFRKELMGNVGYFDENMIDGQHDFYLRVASKYKVFFIAKNLTCMKKHEGNISKNIITSSLTNYLVSLKKLERENLISKVTYKKMKSLIHFKLGLSYKKLNNKKESKKHLLKSLYINPLNFNGLKSIYYFTQDEIMAIKKVFSIDLLRQKYFYSKLINKNDLCFDIGANIGNKSKLFLSLDANVKAFEPQSQCKHDLNNITNKKFEFLSYAIGSKNKTKKLNIANHIEVATFSDKMISYYKNETLNWSSSESVIVKKLDTVIEEFGIPNFCKIDTEGFELEILSNLTHTIPIIEFEFIAAFIEDTIKIISILNKENTLYNYNLNEKPKFELSKWVDSENMINIIKKIPLNRLHGNIFVKNT